MYCNNFYCIESETAAYQMQAENLPISMYYRFTEKNLLLY